MPSISDKYKKQYNDELLALKESGLMHLHLCSLPMMNTGTRRCLDHLVHVHLCYFSVRYCYYVA
jgi:hypothetical protein